MKIGIIDIGSNTIKGFVYKINNQIIQVADKKYIYAHLMSYIKNDKLTEEGIRVLLHAAEQLKNFCELHNSDKIYVFATSAVRSAKNTRQIQSAFYESTALCLDILSEESEAYYDYMSLRYFSAKTGGIGVDLGGGSAQIVVFDKENLLESVSLPIGALRMKNDFVNGAFPTQAEFDIIKKYIKTLITQSPMMQKQHKRIYLIGGTAITVLTLMRVAENISLKNVINMKYLYQIKDILEAMGDERQPFLLKYAKGREKSIIPGIAVLQAIGEYFGCEEFKVMKCGVREGYLIEKMDAGVEKNMKH